MTVWLSPEVEARGGQTIYSDLAITVCLTLGMVCKQPLRQTEGFVRSLVKLLGVEIIIPPRKTVVLSSGYNQRSRGETQMGVGRWSPVAK